MNEDEPREMTETEADPNEGDREQAAALDVDSRVPDGERVEVFARFLARARLRGMDELYRMNDPRTFPDLGCRIHRGKVIASINLPSSGEGTILDRVFGARFLVGPEGESGGPLQRVLEPYARLLASSDRLSTEDVSRGLAAFRAWHEASLAIAGLFGKLAPPEPKR